jgi:effector-binding domain-containing protein
MLTKPKIEDRKEQPFIAIGTRVNMKDIAVQLPPLIIEVVEWMNKFHIKQAGPPFFQYLSIDNNNDLIVNVGVPTHDWVEGDARLKSGKFPAGVYATLSHFGPYHQLKDAHMTLEEWVTQNGWDDTKKRTDNEVAWGGRTEFYITDPQTEPDQEKWQTDVVFSL